jgi:hypothetical protein
MSAQDIYDFIRREAERIGISASAYGLDNEPTVGSGELIFSCQNDKWVIHTTERGNNYDFCYFDNVRDAIRFFFMMLTIDQNNRELPNINFRDLTH